VQLFSRGMLAIAHTDMDCLQHVDFIGCDTVIDLGGTELVALHLSAEITFESIIFSCCLISCK
jgi:hypothetical protein